MNSTPPSIVSLAHELLIIADLCNILIRTRATPFTLPPPLPPHPLRRYAKRRRARAVDCFGCLNRIFAGKPRSGRKLAGGGVGEGRWGWRGVMRTRVSCKGSTHNRPDSRGILLPVPRNKNFTHTGLLWGIRVDTSYRKYLIHTPSDRRAADRYVSEVTRGSSQPADKCAFSRIRRILETLGLRGYFS